MILHIRLDDYGCPSIFKKIAKLCKDELCNDDEEVKKYNIYVGEFIKAILKIVNITNELEKACVIQGNVKLLHSLSEIKGHVLKSIATNQSLYI
tara:strand:- start:169 stop:450 length:282 start_codon:yes stop_codon:yes gene_type:complete